MVRAQQAPISLLASKAFRRPMTALAFNLFATPQGMIPQGAAAPGVASGMLGVFDALLAQATGETASPQVPQAEPLAEAPDPEAALPDASAVPVAALFTPPSPPSMTDPEAEPVPEVSAPQVATTVFAVAPQAAPTAEILAPRAPRELPAAGAPDAPPVDVQADTPAPQPEGHAPASPKTQAPTAAASVVPAAAQPSPEAKVAPAPTAPVSAPQTQADVPAPDTTARHAPIPRDQAAPAVEAAPTQPRAVQTQTPPPAPHVPPPGPVKAQPKATAAASDKPAGAPVAPSVSKAAALTDAPVEFAPAGAEPDPAPAPAADLPDTPAAEARSQAPAANAATSAPAVQSPEAHVPAAAVRGSPETVASLAAQILGRLEAQNTRFEIALDPLGLGHVDIALEIGADGALKARMAFDTPQAAAELRGRSGELRQALEQAGFQLSDGSLSFDLASQGQRDRGGEQGQRPQHPNARAFEALMASEDDAALPFIRERRASGVDIRI